MIELEELEYLIDKIKKSNLDIISKNKVIKELENKKYILENNK